MEEFQQNLTNGNGGIISINNVNIISEYLRKEGNDGTKENGTEKGAPSVISQGLLDCGIGSGRGAGGDLNSTGVGGCLYILSSKIYCICTVQVPAEHPDATVTIKIAGDDFTEGTNTKANVGTITGTGTQTFIVKKGATVEYTVEKEHYIAQGKVENIGTVAATGGTYNSSDNIHTIPVTLKKKILKHTIQTNGANITINGKFTDANGNITNTSMNGTGSITFNVWSGDNNVSYTATKTYYDTKNGSVSVTSNGGTTNVELPKTKYYVSSPSYYHSTNGLVYKWYDTNNLTYDDGNEIRAYINGTNYATITIPRKTGIPNNWIMYLDGCHVGTSSNTRLTVTIGGESKKTINNLSEHFNNNYTIDGTGTTVNNIVIKFEGTYWGTLRNFYLDSVYFVVND